MIVKHCFEPVADAGCRALILGTMPSPASRENGFYYSHPRNRFWQVMARLFGVPVPVGTDEKKALMLREHIALWDVLQSCEIDGASDASIRNAVPNDIPSLLIKYPSIKTVYTTGRTAYLEYRKAFSGKGLPEAIPLPSTSPANARMSLDDLCEAYRAVIVNSEW